MQILSQDYLKITTMIHINVYKSIQHNPLKEICKKNHRMSARSTGSYQVKTVVALQSNHKPESMCGNHWKHERRLGWKEFELNMMENRQ